MREEAEVTELSNDATTDWQRRVVDRSLRTATERSVDRSARLIYAAGVVLDRANGGDITVQDVAEEAGQSLRTLYLYFSSKDDLLLALLEESMRSYAALVERAIAGLDDPLERLAGAMLAALRMPEISESGFNRSLARLRLRLADSSPELVGRSQATVVAVFNRLVRTAWEGGGIDIQAVDSATFLILSMNTAVITADSVGNDVGVSSPEREIAVSFCLGGLGADLASLDLSAIEKRLALPAPRAHQAARHTAGGGSHHGQRDRILR